MAKEKKKSPEMPKHKSPMQSRCEELADKLLNVSCDKTSIIAALKQSYTEGFTEGYARKGFDIGFFRATKRRSIEESWRKIRETIVFGDKD